MSHYQTIKQANNAEHFHRDAYMAAFYEVGVKWHWDELVYEHVRLAEQERERLLA